MLFGEARGTFERCVEEVGVEFDQRMLKMDREGNSSAVHELSIMKNLWSSSVCTLRATLQNLERDVLETLGRCKDERS